MIVIYIVVDADYNIESVANVVLVASVIHVILLETNLTLKFPRTRKFLFLFSLLFPFPLYCICLFSYFFLSFFNYLRIQVMFVFCI